MAAAKAAPTGFGTGKDCGDDGDGSGAEIVEIDGYFVGTRWD